MAHEKKPRIQPQHHSALLMMRFKRPAHDNQAGIQPNGGRPATTKTTLDDQHQSTFSSKWNNTGVNQTWRLTHKGPGSRWRKATNSFPAVSANWCLHQAAAGGCRGCMLTPILKIMSQKVKQASSIKRPRRLRCYLPSLQPVKHSATVTAVVK